MDISLQTFFVLNTSNHSINLDLNKILNSIIDIPTKVPHRSARKYAINSGAKVAR